MQVKSSAQFPRNLVRDFEKTASKRLGEVARLDAPAVSSEREHRGR